MALSPQAYSREAPMDSSSSTALVNEVSPSWAKESMATMEREFRQQMDLDLGPILPFDEIIGGYDPSAHVIDDFFQNKLAFVVLLNFPLTTLEERLKNGASWSRRQWAEVRLAQVFSKRIPAQVNLSIAEAGAQASQYISEYNIWMHHLVDSRGQRLF